MANPSILFVCKSNCGKSLMAEALARQHALNAIEVHSAGTNPGASLNSESIAALKEVGADMSQATPKAVAPEVLARVDRVIILGREAQLELPADAHGTLERWVTDEPSSRGIEGMERMRLIRDDIENRVKSLLAQLQ